MTGLNKFSDKERRLQRRRNHIAKDLGTPKYHQRVVQRKRIEDEHGVWFKDCYWDEEDEEDFR